MSVWQLSVYMQYMRLCRLGGGRWCGGLGVVAAGAGMSVNTARPARQWLIDAGWISVIGKSARGDLEIEIVNKWGENTSFALGEIQRIDKAEAEKRARVDHARIARSMVARNYRRLFESIGERDGFFCANCGLLASDLQIDHIFPVSAGGGSELDNLQLLCRACNRAKGAKISHE